MTSPRERRFRLLLALWFVAISCIVGSAQSKAPQVYVLHLDDTIQPISADYLARGIHEASRAHAEALLVEMNTPGGLLGSTRVMVHDILSSPVPVILYIAPTGSRAGSAGFFLLEAADVAAMAPGTEAGASHPILEGQSMGATLKEKITNDAMAFLRSYVAPRGRNVDAAQEAVLHSKSYTPQEALSLHLIDLIEPSTPALLGALNGRAITRFNGQQVVLHTAGAQLVAVTPSFRERVFDPLMDPNVAVLILITGALLIYLEFHIPGTIVPGALGTLLVVIALFALNMLPVHDASWLLILAAFVLILLEAKFPSHGILAGLGTVLLVVGLLTLVDGPIPQLRVQLATALAAGLGFGIITTILVRAAWRARHNKIMTGPAAMLGAIGIAQEELAPRGQILVRGELWFAEATDAIPAGAHVKVTGVRGLTLQVESLSEATAT
jgi:membrane-bound serine protease (ClpP class)